MGSSKLIAIKPRNHLETQTSAYTLVAYGEKGKGTNFQSHGVFTFPRWVQKETEEENWGQAGMLRGLGVWWWLGEAQPVGSGRRCPRR
jgi:hypothetical protein